MYDESAEGQYTDDDDYDDYDDANYDADEDGGGGGGGGVGQSAAVGGAKDKAGEDFPMLEMKVRACVRACVNA